MPDAAGLGADQIVVKVRKFAFTSNNVTYARLGEPMGNATISYWRFFPAPGRWGVIPVWGVGEVVATRHPGLRAGESLYGYYPMASHAVLQARLQGDTRVVDVTPHRGSLPEIYQDYVLIDRDQRYAHMHDDEYLVLRPAFSLSFCCAHFLLRQRCFGARRIVISSASSKAALGLCFLLANAPSRDFEICGLTSPANAGPVSRHGLYDRVYGYDAVETLPADQPALFVDIAGAPKLLAAVHRHLGDRLVYSCLAGFTHWDSVSSERQVLAGPTPALFSTPAHMIERRAEWGIDGYWDRFTRAYDAFRTHMATRLRIERATGKSEIERAYRAVLDGRASPDTSYVLSVAD